jgi:hypothetical protein
MGWCRKFELNSRSKRYISISAKVLLLLLIVFWIQTLARFLSNNLPEYPALTVLKLEAQVRGARMQLRRLSNDSLPSTSLLTAGDRYYVENNDAVALKRSLVFVVVLSSATRDGFDRRSTMRRAVFAEESKADVRHLFVVGRPSRGDDEHVEIRNEAALFGDLLTMEEFADFDVHDHDAPVRLQTLLQYVVARFSFSWLALVTDDCFINLHRFQQLAQEKRLAPKQLLGGALVSRQPVPIADRVRLSHLPFVDCKRFPPFVADGTAVMSADVVWWLATSLAPFRPLDAEDTALGVWVGAIDVLPVALDGVVADAQQVTAEFEADPRKFLIVKGASDVQLKTLTARL